MTAQPILTNGELDAAIYGTPQTTAIVLVPRARGHRKVTRTPNVIYMPPKVVKQDTRDLRAGDVMVVTADGSNYYPVEYAESMVIPCRALDPDPQPLVFTTPVLPPDEKPAPKSLPSKLFATGMSRDKRGWHVPVFGDPRMWELILPKLQELDAYTGHVAVSMRWDVYLNEVKGSFTEAAGQIRGLVYSFDPFKYAIVDTDDVDTSTERTKTDSDGLKYQE